MRAYPDMKITGRILDGSKVIGYVVVDTTGVAKNIRRDTTIRLAQNLKFINASAYTKDGAWFLKGENGTNLMELPTFKTKRRKAVAV